MINDVDPRPMVPLVINLDADLASIRDDRPCPVCRAKRRHGDNPLWFPSFYLLMRHWEAEHPNEAPPSDRDHTIPLAEMNGLLWMINEASLKESEALIDAWLRVEGEVKE